MEKREYKVIREAKIARKLLKLGHNIVDIKPNRENKSKTNFVFENNEKFEMDLLNIKKELIENGR